jgi:hypothetical protein
LSDRERFATLEGWENKMADDDRLKAFRLLSAGLAERVS